MSVFDEESNVRTKVVAGVSARQRAVRPVTGHEALQPLAEQVMPSGNRT